MAIRKDREVTLVEQLAYDALMDYLYLEIEEGKSKLNRYLKTMKDNFVLKG